MPLSPKRMIATAASRPRAERRQDRDDAGRIRLSPLCMRAGLGRLDAPSQPQSAIVLHNRPGVGQTQQRGAGNPNRTLRSRTPRVRHRVCSTESAAPVAVPRWDNLR
ncbi:hypothetical protein Maq22A_c27740 [Methylobacterium aquaticum]|uniref:Uncharacterized protein n=1 Tax=Methylobacterium aquaticum TaxID=270351 RepID=A0A1Y0ZID5_9HYPH|nr:hypothetical protein Maq22A_c27740 [Methylobacterium aquaticum]